MVERAEIIVRGVVQGVGFRPYVYALAAELGLKGYVINTDDGVVIDVEGRRLDAFLERLPLEAPPLARINELKVMSLPKAGYRKFSIRESVNTTGRGSFTLLSPDVSTCDACLRELLDPSDRRHLYPFINCTQCGPRYSITRAVPYDRPNTTMAPFLMCPDCRAEYDDPRDRRFHAQPNACPQCGPAVEFRVSNVECGGAPHPRPLPLPGGERGNKKAALPYEESDAAEHPLPRGERNEVRGNAAVQAAVNMLKNGGIVAVKGLGGFHLACDASNDGAVQRLRDRKRKSNKPFAVMCPDMRSIELFCSVSDAEQELLRSANRPIALLRKRAGAGEIISGAVAPNNRFLGCLLPYTPLHYLLFHHPLDEVHSGSHFRALVMTSGNLSEEPIVSQNQEALDKLSSVADGFLFHDRDIFMRVDDSVARIWTGGQGDRAKEKQEDIVSSPPVTASQRQVSIIRRSRGYAPEPIVLSGDGPDVLGCGADFKNTFTLTKGGFAIPSQHIGDMENYETLRFFEECLENLKQVYRVDPAAIVHDLHPGYLSTKWARGQAGFLKQKNQPVPFSIQHHYAHIGSVMAERGLKGKVIGVAMDGTGYGTDGNLWGGEFMVADIQGFERCGQFKYIPLPGGEAAIREPWRTAVSMVIDAAGEKAFDHLRGIGFFERYGEETVRQVVSIARSPELSPLASGAGRIFDAVAAILGICDRNTFEGEAPTALEFHAQEDIESEYPFVLMRENDYTVIDFAKTILAIIEEHKAGRDRGIIATKFHNTISAVIVGMVRNLSSKFRITNVALSGGTFQNVYLLERTARLLKEAGLRVYTNRLVPCNDACISLGQAYIVRERLKKSHRA
ncbi:MAG: hypothetical protein A2X56_08355 [Nitrospirae bacterium GWC2_57_13]|jgi:hydrogenase maturation protein HypF|nr:MAG: hypothetical protein A2X56_08355 [Nitrospirae bacterium GWC2_57_13]